MPDRTKIPTAISQILDDRESGSITLLNRLLMALEEELLGSKVSGEEFHSLLAHVGEKLSHFAAIENFLASLSRHSRDGSAFPGEALRFISDYGLHWKKSQENITENFLHQFEPEGKTILTHSHSQTVISLLQQLHQRQISFKVLQTLSLPGEEGKVAHERMLKMQLRSELIADEDVKNALRNTDLVLVGCDALLNTEFLNKAGTGMILHQANTLDIPSFLITESRKRINSSSWKKRLPDLNLFEWVPQGMVKAIVTEIQ